MQITIQLDTQHDGPIEYARARDVLAAFAVVGNIQAIEQHDQPGPASALAVDSAGVPYDERIHSSGRTTMKDGTWTKKRGVPEATYNAVIAELKGAAVEQQPAPTQSNVPPALPPSQPTPSVPSAPPTGGEGQPAPATASAVTWNELQGLMSRLIEEKKATAEDMKTIAAAHGFKVFALIVRAPEKWGAIMDELKQFDV